MVCEGAWCEYEDFEGCRCPEREDEYCHLKRRSPLSKAPHGTPDPTTAAPAVAAIAIASSITTIAASNATSFASSAADVAACTSRHVSTGNP